MRVWPQHDGPSGPDVHGDGNDGAGGPVGLHRARASGAALADDRVDVEFQRPLPRGAVEVVVVAAVVGALAEVGLRDDACAVSGPRRLL